MIPITTHLALAERTNRPLVYQSRQSEALSARQVNRIVVAAGQRAGPTHPNPQRPNITCHLLRHAFARLWKLHGGSIETLSKVMGHSSVATTWDLYGAESLHDMQRNYENTKQKMLATPGAPAVAEIERAARKRDK
ncbi:MAG: site-specific integrase [bacterium]|nr:site-specific integrase [bacterium]